MSLNVGGIPQNNHADNNAMHQTRREGVAALAPSGGQSFRRALQVTASVSREKRRGDFGLTAEPVGIPVATTQE
jgi:hypothetical protein